MEYIFFYCSILVLFFIFIICCMFKKLNFRNMIIGLTTVGYSLSSDMLFGNQFKLFYYINHKVSNFYMILAALLIYSFLNMIYTMFLPEKGKTILIYTAFWIVAMLLFEYASVKSKTIVFTGWIVFPWSIVTYIAAYSWIYLFYRYLTARIPVKAV